MGISVTFFRHTNLFLRAFGLDIRLSVIAHRSTYLRFRIVDSFLWILVAVIKVSEYGTLMKVSQVCYMLHKIHRNSTLTCSLSSLMCTGYCLATFSPDAPVSCCQMSIKGDALICGFTAETRLSTLVLCKNETVNDVVKRNKRRKSSKAIYIFDEPQNRKSSS